MSIPVGQTAAVLEPAGIESEEDSTEEERCRQQIRLNQPAIALLDAWADVDEDEIAEQAETWEFLRQALDEDRLSARKLFP